MSKQEVAVLTKAQQRVYVAYDVIASLKTLKLRTGAFIEAELPGKLSGDSKTIAQRLKKKKECEVCALGACLLSVVSISNDFDFSEANDDYSEHFSANPTKLVNRLSKIFPVKQLALIETTFERGQGWFKHAGESPYKLSYEDLQRCGDFSQNFNSDEHKLRAIMYNIIENKGTFKP